MSRSGHPDLPIERATPGDLVMLAMDHKGGAPERLGAVLVLDAPAATDVATLESVIGDRSRRVPPLRQHLVRVPPGCGRPVWVEDPDADPARQIRRLQCPDPGDEQALLDVAARIVGEPLQRSRPLWSATIVTGLTDGRVGLVIVLHHVVADGIAAVSILRHLVDAPAGAAEAPDRTPQDPPRPRPPWTLLASDALRSRLLGLARLPAAVRDLRASFAAGGGVHPPPATPCSLLRPTGPRRRFAVVRTDLAALHAAAHRHGGTVNDALLAAVAGALHALLERRGEQVDRFRIGLMVGGRSPTAEAVGNTASPMLVDVPACRDPNVRLAAIAGRVRAERAAAGGPPPLALMASLFRVLAALGLLRRYMTHQRRLHAVTSNVHGPDRPLTLAGVRIASITPISAGEAGNVTVGFVALSYAGRLTVTVVADPDHTPDLATLTTALQDELDTLTRSQDAGLAWTPPA